MLLAVQGMVSTSSRVGKTFLPSPCHLNPHCSSRPGDLSHCCEVPFHPAGALAALRLACGGGHMGRGTWSQPREPQDRGACAHHQCTAHAAICRHLQPGLQITCFSAIAVCDLQISACRGLPTAGFFSNGPDPPDVLLTFPVVAYNCRMRQTRKLQMLRTHLWGWCRLRWSQPLTWHCSQRTNLRSVVIRVMMGSSILRTASCLTRRPTMARGWAGPWLRLRGRWIS